MKKEIYVSGKEKRNSSFELMRLLAMYMIVFEHCLLATAFDSVEPLSLADNVIWLLEAFTICAVDLFFLLTGYFMKSGNFRLKNGWQHGERQFFILWVST